MSVGGIVVRLVLLGALIALIAVEDRLLGERATRRDTSNRIGRLITAEEREALEVVALGVEAGDGRVFTYARAPDGWRCVEYHGALASDAALNGLIDRLLEAEGVAQSADAARFADYGLGGGDSWTLRFLGAAGGADETDTDTDTDTETETETDAGNAGNAGNATEVLLTVELGTVVPGEVGAFVRRGDHPAVWALDTNPREFLDPPTELPPLLDPHVVPASWPGGRGRRVDRIEVVRDDGVTYALRLDRHELSQEQLLAGASPYSWTVVVGEQELPAALTRASSFSAFVLGAPWIAVRPSDELAAAGLDRARAQVTLHPAQGEPCTLFIGRTTEAAPDRVPVFNTSTRMLFDASWPVGELLAPSLGVLTEISDDPADPGNPWTAWLGR